MGRSPGVPGQAGLVTQGMGGKFTLQELVSIVKRSGGSAHRAVVREFEDIIVWARLISVNDVEPSQTISGNITVRHSLVSRIKATITMASTAVKKSLTEVSAVMIFSKK